MAMEIRLNRAGRVYRPGVRHCSCFRLYLHAMNVLDDLSQEMVSGVLVISTSSPLSHNGVACVATGQVRPHVTASSSGIFDGFSSSARTTDVARVRCPAFPPCNRCVVPCWFLSSLRPWFECTD